MKIFNQSSIGSSWSMNLSVEEIAEINLFEAAMINLTASYTKIKNQTQTENLMMNSSIIVSYVVLIVWYFAF